MSSSSVNITPKPPKPLTVADIKQQLAASHNLEDTLQSLHHQILYAGIENDKSPEAVELQNAIRAIKEKYGLNKLMEVIKMSKNLSSFPKAENINLIKSFLLGHGSLKTRVFQILNSWVDKISKLMSSNPY